ncbi:10156_t:CDS:2, partial [Gigaspora margarita]
MEQELENYHVSNDKDKDTLITVRGPKTMKVLLIEESFKDRTGVMVMNIGYGDKASRRSPSKGILLCVKNNEVDNLAEALIKLSIDGPMVSYEASSSKDDN